jgi:Na+/H+-translocating membrane pyrophosphatase
VGGMIPVVFSALAMNSVGKAAMDMVYEVRRQFKEIPGIMEEQVNQNMLNVLIFLLKLLCAK